MVTHDPEEALFMSDRVAVVNGGRIEQVGTPEELYKNPVNGFVLSMFGEVNLMSGIVSDNQVDTPMGLVCASGMRDGVLAEVLVRAEGVILDSESPIRGEVVTSRTLGRARLLHFDIKNSRGDVFHVHARVRDDNKMRVDQEVGLRLNDRHVFVFPKSNVK